MNHVLSIKKNDKNVCWNCVTGREFLDPQDQAVSQGRILLRKKKGGRVLNDTAQIGLIVVIFIINEVMQNVFLVQLHDRPPIRWEISGSTG